MKMYYFNPNGYGDEFFVMAENKEQAHSFLLKHIEKTIIEEPCYANMRKDDLEMWKKVNVLEKTSFPRSYTLDEHDLGSVIQSEIA